MTSSPVRVLTRAVVASTLLVVPSLEAQVGVGAHLTPHAGYLVTGTWYDGPVGTNIATTNAPMLGVQGAIPLAGGLNLVGSLAYASGELRIGLPLVGGVNVGSARTWLYDAGLELGGLAGRSSGIAPFVQGGIGGMTNDISASVFETRASNVAYTVGAGLDVGLTEGFALRILAKDWIGRFDSEDAIGFRAEGNLAHNWALTAGVKLRF